MSNKATEIVELSGNYLKNGTFVVEKSISAIYNLFISYKGYQNTNKFLKLKVVWKIGIKTDLPTISICFLPAVS